MNAQANKTRKAEHPYNGRRETASTPETALIMVNGHGTILCLSDFCNILFDIKSGTAERKNIFELPAAPGWEDCMAFLQGHLQRKFSQLTASFSGPAKDGGEVSFEIEARPVDAHNQMVIVFVFREITAL